MTERFGSKYPGGKNFDVVAIRGNLLSYLRASENVLGDKRAMAGLVFQLNSLVKNLPVNAEIFKSRAQPLKEEALAILKTADPRTSLFRLADTILKELKL